MTCGLTVLSDTATVPSSDSIQFDRPQFLLHDLHVEKRNGSVITKDGSVLVQLKLTVAKDGSDGGSEQLATGPHGNGFNVASVEDFEVKLIEPVICGDVV